MANARRYEKIEEFYLLSWDDKLKVQGYPANPHDNNLGTPLPENLPAEKLGETKASWERQKYLAALEAKRELNEECHPVETNPDRDDGWMSGDTDDDDSVDSDMSCQAPAYSCHCMDCKPRKRKGEGGASVSVKRPSAERFDEFFTALPSCLLFDLGFRVAGIFPGDDENCWCPCGKYMRPWRKFFMLDDLEEVERARDVCGPNGGKKKEPMGLVAHLRTQGERCLLHRGIYLYLNNLYGNIWGPGLGHKALYMVNDAGYKAAEAADTKSKQKIYESLREKLQAAEEKALLADKEREAFKAKMDMLDKVNHDHRKKIEDLEKTMDKLKVKKDENKIQLSDNDIISYGKQFRWFIDAMKFKIHSKTVKVPIRINVSNNFDVQRLFESLYEVDKDKSYLMRDLSGPKDVDQHAPKLIQKWNIQYRDDYNRKDRAEDDGGPSREFLSQVWRQMGSLKASENGIKVELFEETSSGYVPITDEKLKLSNRANIDDDIKDQVLMKAKAYYRAIGRIMLHSLITNHPISAITIPKFYRNVIFRDCNFEDSRYPRGEIIKDLLAIGASFLKDLDTLLGSPLNDYIEEEEGVITADNFFTKVVPHMWVNTRSIALNAIKEGMSLNGFVDIQGLFRIMPIEAVSKVAFLREDAKPEDIVGIMWPTYVKDKGSIALENQIHFYEKVFKKVIMDKGKSDVNFLSKFVSFVTSLDFIPHKLANPGFKIEIEFNPMLGNNAFPASKTCENVLFLPLNCYEGNGETFEMKLDESLEQVALSGFSDN